MDTWTSRFWMTNRRNISRYRVDGLRQIKGRVCNAEELSCRLTVFGGGGCGFYLNFSDSDVTALGRFIRQWLVRPGEMIDMEILCDGVFAIPILLSGKIVFSQKTDEDDPKSPWYFGVEFDADSRELANPICEYLDHLCDRGLVELD